MDQLGSTWLLNAVTGAKIIKKEIKFGSSAVEITGEQFRKKD